MRHIRFELCIVCFVFVGGGGAIGCVGPASDSAAVNANRNDAGASDGGAFGVDGAADGGVSGWADAGTVLWDAGGLDAGPPCDDSDAGSLALDDQQWCGSRLKTRWAMTGDGVESFLGWYDSLPGVSCAPGIADDGAVRCLPSNVATDVSYLDRFCTVPVYSEVPGATAIAIQGGSIASDAGPECAAPQERFFEIASTVTATRTYYIDGCGDCDVNDGPTQTSYSVAGAEILPASFVSMTTVVQPASAGVSTQWIHGDDGSHGFLQLENSMTGEACLTASASDGTLRCHPSTLQVAPGIFSDADCLDPVAVGSTCGSARMYEFGVSSSCPSVVTDYERQGSSLEWLYSLSGGTCTPSYSDSPNFLVGPMVPPSAFPIATAVPLSTGRLEPNLAAYAAAGALRYAGWRDAQLAADCWFAPAADGTLRCLPMATYFVGLFSDDACSAPIGELVSSILPGSPHDCSGDAFARSRDDNGQTHIFPVVGPYSGPAYFGYTSGCTYDSYDPGPLVSLGAELPAATFVGTSVVVR